MQPMVDRLMALLFVAEAPVTMEALQTHLAAAEGQVEQVLEALEARLDREGPLMLVRLAGGFQLSTRTEYAHLIAEFLKPQRQRLGRSLMEVLAIVAYRQPITMGEIDQVRGVQSDYGVRALLDRRLIHEVGRKPVAGRPVLYGTTDQFLHQFKLDDLSELPDLNPEAPALEATNVE